jgi:peptide/nickel transport system substrate-binding protein
MPRSRVRRAASWLVATGVVVGFAVVGWQYLEPDFADDGVAAPTTVTTSARGGVTSTSGAPAATTVPATNPATTVPRSPVPEVVVGAVGGLTTLNTASVAGRTPVGVLAGAVVLPSAFVTDPSGTPRLNAALLAEVRLSTQPQMTVEYQIAPRAVWSDGAPVRCDDFVLAWIAGRGAGAGVRSAFASAVSGYDDVGGITCADDGKRVIVAFPRTTPGWELLFAPLLPSHAVLAAAGLTDLTGARNGDSAALSKLAAAWNDALSLDGGLPALSAGPFQATEWVSGQRLVLTRNPAWWGPEPSLDRVELRLFADDTAAAAALAAGEVQVVATPLGAAGAAAAAAVPGVRLDGAGGAAYDHLVVNFRNPLLQNRAVREALARCVPRDRIALRLAAAGEGTGVLLDSFVRVPFQARYQGAAAPAFDPAAARRILAAAGWLGDATVVRNGQPLAIRLLRDDSARSATIAGEIVDGCREAGIAVEDVPVPSGFRDDLVAGGDFDVVLLTGRARLSPVAATTRFATRATDNVGDYSSAVVDELVIGLGQVLDPVAQDALLRRIDAVLWQDVPAVPLTQPAAPVAIGPRVTGAAANPTAAGALWNVDRWSVAPLSNPAG